MMLNVYIPMDSAAVSLGADEVAAVVTDTAARHARNIRVVRNGSFGMYWLEPMLEVETPSGRIAYGPVSPDDVEGLFTADFLKGGRHELYLGYTREIPFLKEQMRLTFQRCGMIDPLSLDDYRKNGGLKGLEKALQMTDQEIIRQISDSGLRGRGGAGFPTGIKWNTAREARADRKYVVCNADEGDSGTFADRMLMEGDPFSLIEGMIVAGLASGATRGYVYLRSEYPTAAKIMNAAISAARQHHLLGEYILGSDKVFDMEVRIGAGAYVCGEETALLNSLEGKRGVVQAKPPLPAINGFMQRPTVINNVISLCTVPVILEQGAALYSDFGIGKSRGTIPIQISGNVKQGGLYETAFGLTLGDIVERIGGGSASGRPVRAVQVGGPSGAYFPRELFHTPFDYEAFTQQNGMIGHAGVVVFDDTVNMMKQARFAMEFSALQSCGKCTPCRIGTTRGMEIIDQIDQGASLTPQIALLKDLCETMKFGSLCALGGLISNPVLSALTYFPEDFQAGACKVPMEEQHVPV